MKHLIQLFLGAFVAWLIISFFTNNYNSGSLFLFILGAISGYQIGKNKR
ncbi:tRNA U-34 5-methylaminomethyl-2-thiouridine biosynthesis protein [Bacillus sp. FJAT-53711]|uniref:tRNA U-34 5-methylaminomethyl-2-thiouridine biosynthesis protein n=1 Tax=Bacillus yunxiaonensis TaxID=3127665 RepID=A0ABU8FU78_9BACI